MGQYLDHYTDQFIESRHYTAWQLIKSYWQSDQRYPAYVFFAIVVVMTVSLVGFDVIFNYWYNYFYNALQAYDKHGVIRLLLVFFTIAAFYIVIAVYRYYISTLFGLRWRRWLTTKFVDRWLRKRGYYLLENFDEKTDNPDQRIQEDVAAVINYSIDLSLGLIGAITTFLAFIYILWQLSGEVTFSLGRLGNIHISGYLVWVGVLYAIIGTFFTVKLGRPLVPLNFEQQRREATFRFAAVEVRTHAEDIALYHGEKQQKKILGKLFDKVYDNYYMIIVRQKTLMWFTTGYNQVAVVLPLMVALPNYFDKVFLLGGLMQSLSAFGKVQDSLSFMVNSYTRIAEFQAITQRLTTFVNHMTDVEEKAERENQVQFKKHAAHSIVTKDLVINTPRSELLLSDINETFTHGNHYLIKGVSGVGKSTFLRTMAGIWPYAAGEVTFPESQRIMYLPQKPYMPIGKLSEAISFPNEEGTVDKEELVQIMRDCKLESFIPRLDEANSWSEKLSPGEQQRVAFARVLLHKPDWAFLDESTSMLDIANEEHLYKMLKLKLPHCSLVSVGHRPSLDVHHEKVINMGAYSYQKQLLM